MAFRPVFERVVNTLGLIQELATVEIANRPSEMFLKHFFLRGTQEEETRLWDWYLCCANMTKAQNYCTSLLLCISQLKLCW